jgi:hypothetical protein
VNTQSFLVQPLKSATAQTPLESNTPVLNSHALPARDAGIGAPEAQFSSTLNIADILP